MKLAHRIVIFSAPLLFFVATTAACGDVCDKQQKIIEADCNIDLPETENTGENVICDGEAARAARCAKKHTDDYCEWLSEFMTQNYDFSNAYTECVEEG